MRRLIAIPQTISAPVPIPVPTPTLAAVSISSSEIDVTASYTGPPGAATYTFLRSLFTNMGSPASPWVVIATQASPSYHDTTLAAATFYGYEVYVTTNETQARTSATSAFAYAATSAASGVPPQVIGVTYTPAPSSFTATFPAIATATSYLMMIAGVLVPAVFTQTGTTVTATLSGLTGATVYNPVAIAAVNNAGTGPYSTGQSVTTLAAVAPGLVPNVTAVPLTPTTVGISGGTPADNGGSPITGYTAQVYTLVGGGGGSGGGGGTLAGSATIFNPNPGQITVAGLTPGTQYVGYLHAFNTVGVGPNGTGANVTTPQQSGTGPPPPSNLRITAQSPTSMSLAWNASTGAVSYKIYRNQTFYATATGTTYTDTAATNANMPTLGGGNPDPNTAAPSTPYTYTVSGVDAQGNEGTQQTLIAYTAYSNGTWAWPGDFSYQATVNYHDTSLGPQGGTGDIAITSTGSPSIWQPYSGGNVGLWAMNVAMMDHLQISLKSTVANQDWSLSLVSRQPSPTGDVFSKKHVNISSYGPIVQGQWGLYTIPLADLTIGFTNLTGTVGAPYGTYTYNSGGSTYPTATLTVQSTQSGVGVDVGAFLTGTGVPASTFVCACPSGNLAGPFTITGPNVTNGLNLTSRALVTQRTDLYKPTLQDLTGLVDNKYGADNFGFYGTQNAGTGGNVGNRKQNILTYLAGLNKGTSNRVLAWQHVNIFSSPPLQDVTPLQAQTGQTVSGQSWVMNYVGPAAGATPLATMESGVAACWAANGFVMVSIYSGIPNTNSGPCLDGGNRPTNSPASASDFTKITTAGSTYNGYSAAAAQLYANECAKIVASGHVVILRPFIEVNNAQNWYSAQNAAQFQALYKQYWNIFQATQVNGQSLNNFVIWMYNVNQDSGNYTAYYPGSQYVDIVSIDIYPQVNSTGAASSQADFVKKLTNDGNTNPYAALVTLGNPLMLGETGLGTVTPSYNAPPANTQDNTIYINAIRNSAPNVIGFSVFCDIPGNNQDYSITNQKNASTLMNDSWIITLADVPAGLN